MLFAFCFLFLTNCSIFDPCSTCDDIDNPIRSVLAFNPNDDAASATITLDCSTSWTLMNTNSLPDWLLVYPYSGEAGTEVNISVMGTNTTGKSLEYPLTFLTNDGKKLIVTAIYDALDISWHNNCDNSFAISTRNELAGLAYLVNRGIDNFKGKTITLTNSIDLSPWNTGKGWIPIGRTSVRSFAGTFDGDGFLTLSFT